jgi:hypothetical protein
MFIPSRRNQHGCPLATVRRDVAAWEARRNQERAGVGWHFTTAQARRELKRLYPHPA